MEWERGTRVTGNDAQTVRLWRRSIELDPTWVTSRSSLWSLLVTQTSFTEADEVLRPLEQPDAYQRATPAERAKIRYMRALMDGNWAEQLAADQEVARLEQSPFSTYSLANLERRARRPREALGTLSGLRPEDFPVDTTAWLWLRGTLYHALGQHREQLDAARLGQQHYPFAGGFLAQEAGALVGLGRLANIEDVINRSERAALRSGGMGSVLLTAARELSAHGHADAARTMAGRAVAWYEARTDGVGATVASRVSHVMALLTAGNCEEGLALVRNLARAAPDDLGLRAHHGVGLALCGQREEAARIADGLAREDRPFLHGLHLYQRARVLAALGDREGAVRSLQESFRRGYGWDIPNMHVDPCWDPIRDYAPFKNWMQPRE